MRTSAWVLSSLCVLLSVSVARSDDLPDSDAEWQRIAVEDLTVLTNGDPPRAIELAEELLALRATMQRLSTGMIAGRLADARIFVFANAKTFRPYMPIYRGKRREVGGYFVQGTTGDLIAIGSNYEDYDRRALFHEYIHAWLSANFPRAPLWFHEGMAEYYSTFDLDGEVALVGQAIPYYLDSLRRGGTLPLRRVFEVGYDSPEYNESNRNGLFYATSWALVRMLLLDDGFRAQLVPLLRALSRGEDSSESIRTHLHVDLSTLESQLRNSIEARSSIYYRVPMRLPVVDDRSARPLPRYELLEHLGDLALAAHWSRSDVARRHYEAALELNPRSAAARVGLGWLAYAARDSEAVLRWAHEAVEAQPANAQALSFAAMAEENALDWDAFMEDIPASTVPEGLLRAREYARRSLRIRPGNATTMGYLGRTWLLEADNAEGIAWTRRALSLEPQSLVHTSDLCMLLANADSLDAARYTLRRGRLLPRGESQLAQVTAFVVRAGIRRALTLAESNRFGEARSQLDLSRPLTSEPELLAEIDAAVERVAELESAHVRQLREEEWVQRYNSAVEWARAGDLETARRTVDALLQESLGDELRAEAERLLAAIQQHME